MPNISEEPRSCVNHDSGVLANGDGNCASSDNILKGLEKSATKVSSFQEVDEIQKVLTEREETCHRTCFSLTFNGKTLDPFSELKNIEGLGDGAELRVVEGSYTFFGIAFSTERYNLREAKNHVRHVHSVLHSVDLRDAYLGREQMSLSFVTSITGNDILGKWHSFQTKPDPDNGIVPPDYLIPGNSATRAVCLPLVPLHPQEKLIKCLKQMNFSNWNPPPTTRRLVGDLLYLYVHTLEDKRFHITSCPRGFYVNRSVTYCFSYSFDTLYQQTPSASG
ncbi:unnamed protein product [Protopolystoma xenopodis]|uniref:Clustered mitochondria protein N-terminal domain-containing protein n=1 Tax=Protopolystoma xenopodis TaxID=117903 RepID=A0A448XNG2_9PLAT|nr:unnamed protein product [Protopolystoma xenopodis]